MLASSSSNAYKVILFSYFFLDRQLISLDISYNQFTGTIPTEIGMMRILHTVNAAGNRLQGSLPNEMLHMNPNLRLNFTDNLCVYISQ
jgi:hypothetical protein